MERWLPVVGYEDRYEVSDLGRVRSLVTTSGKRREVPLIRSQHISTTGYPQVTITVHCVRKNIPIHIMVLEAFVGPRPANYEACHNDGIKTHSHLGNLRWDTRLANSADKRLHGTAFGQSWMRGAGNPFSRLNEDDIRCIRAEPEWRGVGRMLAKAFGVTPENIYLIRKGKAWAHVPQYL